MSLTLTSMMFFAGFALSVLLYYLLPKGIRWFFLLLVSIGFYLVSADPWTGIYLLAAILATFLAGRAIEAFREKGKKKAAALALGLGLAADLGLLTYLKYTPFLVQNANVLFSRVSFLPTLGLPKIVAPLGVSFYTLSAVRYLLDVYWEISPCVKSPLRTALYTAYWPVMTSGPVIGFGELEKSLGQQQGFSFRQVRFGLLRMAWGVFKKLVIASRAGVLVDTIYADPAKYPGLFIWFAAGMFMIQLYADFSGCMDIILGASECYGVILPENFRTPFFSRSVQEFWQRWHMTLGGFMRDYILYPLLRSSAFRKMGKSLKARFGKGASRKIPPLLGTFVVWLLMGLWHGGAWKYILGQGMWFFACIACSMILEDPLKKLNSFLGVKTESFGWHLFQSLRVFILVCVGNMFFRLPSFREALLAIRAGFSVWNPEIFFDGKLYTLGLDAHDFLLLVVALLAVLVVSILEEQGESVRERLERQGFFFRSFVTLFLLYATLMFGKYGPGYDAASFIYEKF